MSALIQTVYAYWQKIPAGIRAGLTVFATILAAAGMAFGWQFPAEWAGAVHEIVLFWVFIVPVAVAAFQKSVWPPLFAWLLSQIQLAPTVEGKSLVAAWKPAK